jgi:transcriptional regulator with XRE-family HTH domain
MFVRERLAELEIRQSDFCRLSMFDQGLLSKIQNSVVTSLSLESVLKLAVGLSVPPQRIFNLLDRMDMHDLVIKSYASEFSDMVTDNLRDEAPEIADRLRMALKEAAGKLSLENGKTRRRRWQSNHLNKAVNGAETGA